MKFTINKCKECPGYSHVAVPIMQEKHQGHCIHLKNPVFWDVIDEDCPFIPENEGKIERATVGGR